MSKLQECEAGEIIDVLQLSIVPQQKNPFHDN